VTVDEPDRADVTQIGDEAYDWLTHDHPDSHAIPIARAALRDGSTMSAEPVPDEPDDHDPLATWYEVDLRPVLAGEHVTPTPEVLRREDGAALFYRGRSNGVHGGSGAGKGWLAAVAVAQEIGAGRHVVWIDFEDPDATVLVERLRVLGCRDDLIADLVHYHRPTEPTSRFAVDLLGDEVRRFDARLVVVDSIGEAFALDGIDENKDAEVGPWLRSRARRLADETNAAVVLIDHSTKAPDNVLHPSGSKRKRAAITGASYLVEDVTPLTRERGGRLRVRCAKDRHGHYKRGETVAVIVCTVYPDGGSTWHVDAPAATREPTVAEHLDAAARAAVAVCKRADHALSQNELVALVRDEPGVRGSSQEHRAAIDQAIGRGALRVEVGPRRSRLHSYVHDLPPVQPIEDEQVDAEDEAEVEAEDPIP
jgi:hypothetical protein